MRALVGAWGAILLVYLIVSLFYGSGLITGALLSGLTDERLIAFGFAALSLLELAVSAAIPIVIGAFIQRFRPSGPSVAGPVAAGAMLWAMMDVGWITYSNGGIGNPTIVYAIVLGRGALAAAAAYLLARGIERRREARSRQGVGRTFD